MDLIKFDYFPLSNRFYGGASALKQGILMNGKNYMIKMPQNVSKMSNVELHYSNAPISEFLGSNIYRILGFNAQNTVLGTYNDKLVVACEDFLSDDERLVEFQYIKNSYIPQGIVDDWIPSSGNSTDLDEVKEVLYNHKIFDVITDKNMTEHFWDMFIVDAMIGNNDRNNGNWGIITSGNDKRTAPVYDNGACLNPKWSDEQMKNVLFNKEILKNEAYNARRCLFEQNGKRINPYHYISRVKDNECNNAVIRAVPRIKSKFNEIKTFIESFEYISDVRRDFYCTIMLERLDEVLIPAYEKAMDIEQSKEKELPRKSVKEQLKEAEQKAKEHNAKIKKSLDRNEPEL